jgi:uncharacterized protein DUF6011
MFNAAAAFDDLEDAAYWADAPSENITPFAERAAREAPVVPLVGGATFTQRCDRCRGSGRFIGYTGRDLGVCHACQGRKVKTFKTAPEARAKARVQAADRKVRTADAWHAAHPAESAWLAARAPRSDFARSLQDAVAKYGSLTDNQLAAVQRSIAKDAVRDAERAQERAERAASAPAVEITKIADAFAAAKGRGLKFPRLRLGDFVFTLAGERSKRPGSINVAHATRREFDRFTGAEKRQYLGNIAEGKFTRGFKCEPTEAAEIAQVCADPEAAAVAYGRRFGQCACCGKELTNHESIERGIGPICAEKYGW